MADQTMDFKIRLTAEDRAQASLKAAAAAIKEVEAAQRSANTAAQAWQTLGARSGEAIRADMEQVKAALASIRGSGGPIEDLGRATQAASQRLRELGRGLALVERPITGIERLFSKVTQAFLALQVVLQGAEIANAADNFEKLRITLAQSEGSMQGAQRALSELYRIAQSASVPIEAMTVSYQRYTRSVAAMGGSQQQALDFTEALAKALRLSNATAQETGSVMRQLSQAFNKGKLNGDEFVSVSENGGRVLDYLARQIGKSRGELQEMSKAGELTDKVLLQLGQALEKIRGDFDLLAVPDDFVNLAAPNKRLAPNLAKRGMQLAEAVQPTTFFTYFGMEHPVVGGYEPHKVALRRALSLAYDTQREIDLVRKGRPMPAQSLLPPGVSGYDAQLKSEMSQHDPARAKALLDLYGYVDRDGDGWRDQPDGQPLVLEYTAQPDQLSRQLQNLWHKAMTDLGVRIEFRIATWQENIKASRAGKLMMWGSGWSAAVPDGGYFLDLLYGKNKGMANHARFDLPAFNALYEKQRAVPDGPERDALIREATRLSLAYMPYKATVHVASSWVMQPGVTGYRPHPFIRDYWRYLDIEPAPASR